MDEELASDLAIFLGFQALRDLRMRDAQNQILDFVAKTHFVSMTRDRVREAFEYTEGRPPTDEELDRLLRSAAQLAGRRDDNPCALVTGQEVTGRPGQPVADRADMEAALGVDPVDGGLGGQRRHRQAKGQDLADHGRAGRDRRRLCETCGRAARTPDGRLVPAEGREAHPAHRPGLRRLRNGRRVGIAPVGFGRFRAVRAWWRRGGQPPSAISGAEPPGDAQRQGHGAPGTDADGRWEFLARRPVARTVAQVLARPALQVGSPPPSRGRGGT